MEAILEVLFFVLCHTWGQFNKGYIIAVMCEKEQRTRAMKVSPCVTKNEERRQLFSPCSLFSVTHGVNFIDIVLCSLSHMAVIA
jgi:hypothetical protein